jgi:hypothetical protein
LLLLVYSLRSFLGKKQEEMAQNISIKQQQTLNLIKSQFQADNSRVDELEGENNDLRDEICDLQATLEHSGDNPLSAKTLLGEQKNEILLKLRQLPLEKLQELEKEHCEKIVLHSQNND